MLKLFVVDRSAEGRAGLAAELHRLLGEDVGDIGVIPRVSVTPLAPHELKFHPAPDMCIAGCDITSRTDSIVADVRAVLPDTPIIARIHGGSVGLAEIEHLARAGADDVLAGEVSAADLLGRLILLARKRRAKKTGTMVVVDGGKGGVGVTTVAAAVAAAAAERGLRVVVVDFDVETQDASRFLYVRPFINENLRALFDHHRPITREFVEQCAVPVWGAENNLWCMPPIDESEHLYAAQNDYSRLLVSILEILDDVFDCVVVDVGSARGALLSVLYRAADKGIFVVNGTAASLCGAGERARRMRSALTPSAELLVVENQLGGEDLPRRFFRREFERAAGLDETAWVEPPINCSRAGARWPGSGETLYSCGGAGVGRAIDRLVDRLGFNREAPREAAAGRWELGAFVRRWWPILGRPRGGVIAAPAPHPTVPALPFHNGEPRRRVADESRGAMLRTERLPEPAALFSGLVVNEPT